MREILPELGRRQVDSVTRFFETWPKQASWGDPVKERAQISAHALALSRLVVIPRIRTRFAPAAPTSVPSTRSQERLTESLNNEMGYLGLIVGLANDGIASATALLRLRVSNYLPCRETHRDCIVSAKVNCNVGFRLGWDPIYLLRGVSPLLYCLSCGAC